MRISRRIKALAALTIVLAAVGGGVAAAVHQDAGETVALPTPIGKRW